MVLAASVQQVSEARGLKLACSLQAETGSAHLCLADGIALNCVANGKLQRATAATAPGGDGMEGSYLEPNFRNGGICYDLTQIKAQPFHNLEDKELCAKLSELKIRAA